VPDVGVDGGRVRALGLERVRVLTGVLEVLAGGPARRPVWPPALWVSAGGVALLMLASS
jgi:hypothetical protein